MEPKLEINRCLSREHKELSHLLQSFRNFLYLHGIGQQPDWSSTHASKLLNDLRTTFGSALPRHFAIEEDELFPLLEGAGLWQLVEILQEDHRLIKKLIGTVKPLLDKAQKNGRLTEQEWQRMWREGDALVTELSDHAEREEIGLMPELEEILEDEQADEIYRRYRASA